MSFELWRAEILKFAPILTRNITDDNSKCYKLDIAIESIDETNFEQGKMRIFNYPRRTNSIYKCSYIFFFFFFY